jgi:hypothetical protein
MYRSVFLSLKEAPALRFRFAMGLQIIALSVNLVSTQPVRAQDQP